MMRMSRLFETECCQRLLAQLRVLGEKEVMIQKQTNLSEYKYSVDVTVPQF